MPTKIARRCRECGEGHILPMAKAGRKEKYRTMMLELPEHVKIPTCNKCGAEWLDTATARAIDEALKQVYQASLRTLLAQALEKIRAKTSMRKVENLLGLSEGYLSKVSNSRSEPSAELVSHLGTIAMNPADRLQELEAFWTRSPTQNSLRSRKKTRAAKTPANDSRI